VVCVGSVHGRLLGDGRLVEPGGAVELASEGRPHLSPRALNNAPWPDVRDGVITAMRPVEPPPNRR
jgi:hypothetical protein